MPPATSQSQTQTSVTAARGSFLTHSRYIEGFDAAITSRYYPPGKPPLLPSHSKLLAGLAFAVESSAYYASIAQSNKIDAGPVINILRNAWGTELLLNMTGHLASEDFLGMTNNWVVVQGYYAAYHAIQALIVASGQARPLTHPSTQKHYAAIWVATDRQLSPWSFAVDSNGAKNTPTGLALKTVTPWKACDWNNCWDWVTLALRTTRRDTLDEQYRRERGELRSQAKKKWDAVEKQRLADGKKPRKVPIFPLPQLRAAGKAAVNSKLRPTTLLDYLYRLRIRSQYDDATMFTDGPVNYVESGTVHYAMSHVISATLLTHELLIGQFIGRKAMKTALDKWESSVGSIPVKIGVHSRRPLIT